MTRATQKGACTKCGRTMKIATKGMCGTCYRRQLDAITPPVVCKNCGFLLPHKAFGLCSSCYLILRNSKPCPRCGRVQNLKDGLCFQCRYELFTTLWR